MSDGLRLLWATSLALVVGVIFGVTLLERATPRTNASSGTHAERIVLITHGQAADPFWNIVRHGAEDAAKQLGVRIDYRAPETFDMIRMSELITSATNQRPAGIIVSIPDSNALGGAIRNAVRMNDQQETSMVFWKPSRSTSTTRPCNAAFGENAIE